MLMPTAKKDEVTVVQIESEGYNKQTVILISFSPELSLLTLSSRSMFPSVP